MWGISSWLPLLVLTAGTVFTPASSELKLLILHTNDMHARFEETNAHSGVCWDKEKGRCYGGFARLRTAVDQLRAQAEAEGRATLFLNAGDTYQGSLLFSVFRWKVASELNNMLGIDVMSLGNHEFDDGPAGLAPFLANSSVPVVCCNIDTSQEPTLSASAFPQLAPSRVLEVAGVKVGVIGYLTPDTTFTADAGSVRILDEVESLKKEVARLKAEGVHILIALGHSGFMRDKKIAEEVPDLDLVVGGHTNTFLYTGNAPDLEKPEGEYPTLVTQPSGRKVPVVQAYAFTKYLGYLRLTFDDSGEVVHTDGNPVLLNGTFKKDGAVERVVLSYVNQMDADTGRKVGVSRVFLEGGFEFCRTRECTFGNFVTDAIVDYNIQDYSGEGWTDAPVAFVQGGSLRASISPDHSHGVIKYSDLITALPYTNSIERLTLSGDTLKDVLEFSVERYSVEERVGAFLQYSGIQVQYDLTRPAGQRVVSALVRCAGCPVPKYYLLERYKDYAILTTTYLAGGGDGFTMLSKASNRVVLSFSDVEAVEWQLGRMSPVHPELSGRIQFKDDYKGAPSSARLVYSKDTLPLLLAIVCLFIGT